MKNVNQIHNGFGDNVGGDKTITGEVKDKEFVLPDWAQWASVVVGILTLIWAIYIYIIPR